MSIGPASAIAASVAGTPLAQTRGTNLERTGQDLGVQQHAVQGEQKAEAASGVGQTDGEDHQTGERDADGRLPCAFQSRAKRPPPPKTLPRPRAPKTPPARAAICSTSAGDVIGVPSPSGRGPG